MARFSRQGTMLLLAPALVAQAPEKLPFSWRAERVEDSYEGSRFMERPTKVVLEKGAVEAEGVLLLADRITFNRETEELEAIGHIRLEAPDLRLRCERLRMHWGTKVGEAYALELEVPPEWTLRSDKVLFNTLRHWSFQKVEVNACPQETPGWSARLGRLDINIDGYATLRGAHVYLGKVPTPIYLPWGIYPAKDKRASGLLFPSISKDSRFGAKIGLPYYQTLGDRADLTFDPEYYSRQGALWGGQLRWQPDPTHRGTLSGQLIHQRIDNQRRYRGSLQEVWQREDGWNLAADVNQASDALLEADYGRGTGTLGTTSYDSSFYVGKSFALASFSLTAGEQRTFFQMGEQVSLATPAVSLKRRTLPTAEIRIYPIAVGPFYLDGGVRSGSLSYRLDLGVLPDDSHPTGHYTWGRDDGYLRFQGRLGQLGPVRSDFQSLMRYTRYGASLSDPFFTPENGESGFGDALKKSGLAPFTVDAPGMIRRMASSRLQFSGPQIGRVFERFTLFGWRSELKHVMEPFVAFTYNSGFALADRVPRFDEVDARPGVAGSAMGEQSVELGFKQHFLGRPGKGVVFADLLRWRASVKFHTRPVLLPDGRLQKKGWGSVDNELDVEPDDRLRLSFRRSSEVGESGSDSALSAEYRGRDGSQVNLAIFSTGLNRFLLRQRGIQLGGIKRFWDDRVRFEYNVNYALPNGGQKARLVSSQLATAYVTPCLATILRYTRVAIQLPGSPGRESRVELALELRGLGELGKLRW